MANSAKRPRADGGRPPASSHTSGGGKRSRPSAASSPAKRSAASGTETTPSKISKGLRHFSMRVCKKVEEKGTTSYNEVADELVREFIQTRRAEIAAAGRDPDAELPLPGNRKGGKGAGTNASSSAAAASSGGGGKGTPSKDNKGYDEKNIRRRVYDALNVLMAMDIISKEKKQITWKGLPSSAHHDLDVLQRERRGRLEEVRRKQECLQELLVQNICFSNLVRRNEERKRAEDRDKAAAAGAAEAGGHQSGQRQHSGASSPPGGVPPSATGARDPPPVAAAAVPEGSGGRPGPGPGAAPGGPPGGFGPAPPANSPDSRSGNFPVHLPFIVVNTSSRAVIKCDMNPDRTDVAFDFSLPFEINDDNEVLKRLQLDKITAAGARDLFPKDLHDYALEHHLLDPVLVSPDRMPRTDRASVEARRPLPPVSGPTVGEYRPTASSASPAGMERDYNPPIGDIAAAPPRRAAR